MKKKYIILLIIVLLLFTNIYQYSYMSRIKLISESNKTELRKSKYLSDELLIEANTRLNVTRNELLIKNKDIEVYTRIIADLFNNRDLDYLRKLYDFNAYFLIDNMVVDIPKNGVLYTSEDSFTFLAELTPMPSVGNFQVNHLLQENMFQPIFQTLYYPSADESIETNNKLELTYDLDVGESIQFKLKRVFQSSFGLDMDTIKIERFDPKDYKEGADYYINQPMVKVFSFEEELTYHNYYEVTKDYVIVRPGAPSIDFDGSYDNKIYIFNGAVCFSMWDLPVINSVIDVDSVILPSSIFVGFEWSDYYSSSYNVITSLDTEIDVLGNPLKCLEISTYYNDELSVTTYYAEGIGAVKYNYVHGNSSDLVNLEYLE